MVPALLFLGSAFRGESLRIAKHLSCMVISRKLLTFLFLCLFLLPVSGWSTEGLNSSLFKAANESDIHVPIAERGGAQFLEMDRGRFEGLASRKEFTCLIQNFPLASDGNYDLRVEQFDVVTKNIKGRFPVPAHVFFRGSVDGIAGSHVCLAMYEDCAWGYIVAGERTYALSSAGRSEAGNLILGVIADSTTAANFVCGVEDFKKSALSPLVQKLLAHQESPQQNRVFASSIPQFSIGLEMDSPFVKKSGGNAVSAFKYGLAILAAASDLYLRDAGITLACATHLEWTSNDGYPDVNVCDLLDVFDGSNLPGDPANINVLLSGRSMDVCGGKAAGIGTLCNTMYSKCVCGITNSAKKNGWDYPYHIWVWDLMVVSHETGHVVACPHTHSCYWDPPLDSCVAAEPINWGDPPCFDPPVPSRGTIMSYCHTTTAGAILRFHPRCSELIDQMVSSYTCGTTVSQPQLAVSPQRVVHECMGGSFRFTLTASGSTGPYTFESNPPADSILSAGSNCTLVLNPSKAQKFYVRVTDSSSVRAYDSIIFLPIPGYQVQIRIDTTNVPADSALLIANMADTTGVAFTWYRLPNPLHSTAGTGSSIIIARSVAVQYAVRAASSGGCSAQDTVLVPASSLSRGVSEIEPTAFRMFPNPAADRLTVIFPATPTRCWIEDMLGRRIEVPSLIHGEMPHKVEFELARLSPGTYWMVSETAGKLRSSAFEKQ